MTDMKDCKWKPELRSWWSCSGDPNYYQRNTLPNWEERFSVWGPSPNNGTTCSSLWVWETWFGSTRSLTFGTHDSRSGRALGLGFVCVFVSSKLSLLRAQWVWSFQIRTSAHQDAWIKKSFFCLSWSLEVHPQDCLWLTPMLEPLRRRRGFGCPVHWSLRNTQLLLRVEKTTSFWKEEKNLWRILNCSRKCHILEDSIIMYGLVKYQLEDQYDGLAKKSTCC